MLTPVDIQQKKFKTGLGYEKKDVQTFFEEVSKSYEELYRSNAELKEKVITLTDNIQHYKTTEDSLQKSLLLAEKTTQESKTNATREARNIELEAKNRANEIVNTAFSELELMEAKMKELESRYAEYKSRFAMLIKQQCDFLEVKDFDPSAMIDPAFLKAGGSPAPQQAAPSFEYGGDPQMRESTLGGGSTGGGLGGGSLGGRDETSSTASVYGSVLGGNGIDPFGDNKPK